MVPHAQDAQDVRRGQRAAVRRDRFGVSSMKRRSSSAAAMMGGFTAASSALRPRPTNRRRGSLGGEGQLRLPPRCAFGRASDLLDAQPQM